jgi:hypothetical protein
MKPSFSAAFASARATPESSISATVPQDQELHVLMVVVSLGAGHEGVQPLNPVHQPVFEQEFQRPVDGGRHGRFAHRLQLVKQLVGGERPFSSQDELEHAAPQSGQQGAVLCADARGVIEPRRNRS